MFPVQQRTDADVALDSRLFRLQSWEQFRMATALCVSDDLGRFVVHPGEDRTTLDGVYLFAADVVEWRLWHRWGRHYVRDRPVSFRCLVCRDRGIVRGHAHDESRRECWPIDHVYCPLCVPSDALCPARSVLAIESQLALLPREVPHA